MTKNKNVKSDDRSDNIEKLKATIKNTLENLEAAEEIIPFSSPEEKAKIDAKNERRKESILALSEEIKDEEKE